MPKIAVLLLLLGFSFPGNATDKNAPSNALVKAPSALSSVDAIKECVRNVTLASDSCRNAVFVVQHSVIKPDFNAMYGFFVNEPRLRYFSEWFRSTGKFHAQFYWSSPDQTVESIVVNHPPPDICLSLLGLETELLQTGWHKTVPLADYGRFASGRNPPYEELERYEFQLDISLTRDSRCLYYATVHN